MNIISDKLLLKPEDIKPKYAKVIGVFNPALAKINNKILLIARITEQFKNKDYISWLLPIELNKKPKLLYNKAILPKYKLQEQGIEDPRITKINNKYYMTLVGYSKNNKINTFLYQLNKNLTTKNLGIIFNHKDIVLFPKKINNNYTALTRQNPKFIGIAHSKDLINWKQTKQKLISIKGNTKINQRIGAGPPPILTKKGWLQIIHGVEKSKDPHGTYRTYKILINKNLTKATKPKLILEANPKLDKQIKNPYLKNVVFTTGLIKYKKHYLLASGELDTATRLTEIK